jgi:hypothetical protein
MPLRDMPIQCRGGTLAEVRKHHGSLGANCAGGIQH